MSNAATATATASALPTVRHVRDEYGVVHKYIDLADYLALSEAAVDLCERMSALPQVVVPVGDLVVLDLVLGTKVREAA